jgi:copper homeostasis protein
MEFSRITLEVCCGGWEDGRLAFEAGADRIELNSGLELGGLTPDIGAVKLCQEHLDIPIITMIRPRGGGFVYSPDEFLQMQKDAELILETGVKGLAFGILLEDGSLDVERCRILADLTAQEKGREAVFHMAFDDCVDEGIWTLQTLRELGFVRVLTKGRAQTALEGTSNLRAYVESDTIEILPGGGVRPNNAKEILGLTGANQIHGRFHVERDGSQVVDGAGLKEYVRLIHSLSV